MEKLSLSDDCIKDAFYGLYIFRKNFCFDKGNSVYRRKKCPFENHKTNICIIKKFINENIPKDCINDFCSTDQIL